MTGWRDDKVLVTGAGGFIGSHLTEELVRSGVRVRAFLHYNSRADRGLLELAAPEISREIEFVFGELKDADTVRRAARGVGAIFHLGALIGIPYSYHSPRDVVETNVIGTLNVLEAAREAGAKVLHTSTSEVYGTARYVPIDEGHPLQAQSPYAASKIGADKIAESFFRSFDLPVCIVRPFNTYGPRQSSRAVIPTIISQALLGPKIRLGSLAPTRDLSYVADTVAGFISIADAPGVGGETINLGTGCETSISQLVQMISRIVGRELVVEQDPQRLRPSNSEVERLIADPTKSRALCGWAPVTPLEEGLRRTVEWIQANLARYRPEEYGV